MSKPSHQVPDWIKVDDHRLQPSQICACVVVNKVVRVITPSEIILYGGKLADVKVKLHGCGFEEVGKHGVVNPDHILDVVTSGRKMELVLTGGHRVHVSTRNQRIFK